MDKNLKWLVKERNKDRNEILSNKNKFIKEILELSKDDIVSGPNKIEKEKTWKSTILKMLGL